MKKKLDFEIEELTPEQKAQICRWLNLHTGVTPEKIKEEAKKVNFKIHQHPDGTITRVEQ